MTLNMNNELNARFHRNAVIDMFSQLKAVGAEIDFMLWETLQWGASEESRFDKLKDKRHSLVNQLKRAGMFL